ncbi:hypothetical protein V2H45_17880 [Tumidithrix elongata RA019]|uniref:Uncharacterized protein n=1 Tax=Tumidithrix elongata BACA0141 TaxID=2716417 RepID=A0AAW9PTN8_9CYAN|nr:hypothetical protein [Tumidithrix elongata RA019]
MKAKRFKNLAKTSNLAIAIADLIGDDCIGLILVYDCSEIHKVIRKVK